MSYCVNLVVQAKPEMFADMVAFFADILPDTAKYAGAELISCYSDPATCSLTVHEIWDSKESQQAYLNWRVETGVVAKIGQFLAGPPSFEEYTHVPF